MHRKFKHWYVKSICAGKIPAKSALQTFVSFFKQFFFLFFFFTAMISLSFKKQNAYDRGRKIGKLWIIHQSLWQLFSLAGLWLFLNFWGFFNLFPQWIKRTTNTSSADSVKFVNSDKLALSEIYKNPYPKSTRSIGVLGQNDLIQWKVVYSELCSL